jgi:hypothetical protein
MDARPADRRRPGPRRVTGSLPLCYARGLSRIAVVPIRQIAAIGVVGRIQQYPADRLEGQAPRRELAHFPDFGGKSRRDLAHVLAHKTKTIRFIN